MKQLMENWRHFASGVDAHGEVTEEKLDHDLSGSSANIDSKKIIGPSDDDDEDDELEEWKAEDDDSYPSRKKRKRDKYALKPEKGSWVPGARELATGGLAKGYVGMSEKKKPRKKHCHAYNPFKGKDGRFVDPEKEAGSYSMKAPDADSPDDCTWGQARRSSANRSTQSTKRDCGRKGPYRCKDGSRKYEEELVKAEDLKLSGLTLEGSNEQFEAYISGIISRELDRAIQKHMKTTGCSVNQLLRTINLWSQSEKGELFKKPDAK